MTTLPCLAWKPLPRGSSLHSWRDGPAVGRCGDQLEDHACPPEAPPGVPAATGKAQDPLDHSGGPSRPRGAQLPLTSPASMELTGCFAGYYSCPGGSQLREKGPRPGEGTHGRGDGEALRTLRTLGPQAWGQHGVLGAGRQVLTGPGSEGSPGCCTVAPEPRGAGVRWEGGDQLASRERWCLGPGGEVGSPVWVQGWTGRARQAGG